MKNFICCICGKPIEDSYGNNPWPVVKDDSSYCCNDCNYNVVIPARLKNIFERREEN